MSEFLKFFDLNQIDFLKFVIPLFGAIFAWYLNETRKRAWEEYERKESNYKELLLALKGFYASTHVSEKSKEFKNKFIDQLNLCWLYSPDEVIRAGYDFIRTVHTDQVSSDEKETGSVGSLYLGSQRGYAFS